MTSKNNDLIYSIRDCETIFKNSGMIDWDHDTYTFIESDFIEFFCGSYSSSDCERAFVEYMSETNNVSIDKILSDYSIRDWRV